MRGCTCWHLRPEPLQAPSCVSGQCLRQGPQKQVSQWRPHILFSRCHAVGSWAMQSYSWCVCKHPPAQRPEGAEPGLDCVLLLTR